MEGEEEEEEEEGQGESYGCVSPKDNGQYILRKNHNKIFKSKRERLVESLKCLIIHRRTQGIDSPTPESTSLEYTVTTKKGISSDKNHFPHPRSKRERLAQILPS